MKRLMTLTLLILALASPAYACTATKWCGKKHSAAYNKAAIRTVAAKRHVSASATRLLVKLAYRESTWRNLAINGPCLGLFQLHTHVAKSKWASPYWNTNRAITYIRDRYGSVENAWAHSQRYGYY